MPIQDDDARDVGRKWARKEFVEANQTAHLTREDLMEAAKGFDRFVSEHLTEMVDSLPQPFRGTTTPAQKYLLGAYVLLLRGGYVNAQNL